MKSFSGLYIIYTIIIIILVLGYTTYSMHNVVVQECFEINDICVLILISDSFAHTMIIKITVESW